MNIWGTWYIGLFKFTWQSLTFSKTQLQLVCKNAKSVVWFEPNTAACVKESFILSLSLISVSSIDGC